MPQPTIRTPKHPYDAAKGARAAMLGRRSMTITAIVGLVGLLNAGVRILVIAEGQSSGLEPGKATINSEGWLGLYAFLQTVGLVVTGVAIVGFVFRLMWAWRATTNGAALELPARRAPGWAIGSWFIPVANLVIPFQSIEDAGPPELRPQVRRWWVLTAAGLVLVFFGTLGATDVAASDAGLGLLAALTALGNVCFIAQAFVGIPMVTMLERAHVTLAEQRGAHS